MSIHWFLFVEQTRDVTNNIILFTNETDAFNKSRNYSSNRTGMLEMARRNILLIQSTSPDGKCPNLSPNLRGSIRKGQNQNSMGEGVIATSIPSRL